MAIDVNDLSLFAKVIEYGSFTTAAERIGLPKSTLSRRISYLEQQLGERLITRNTRKISITDFGQAVLEHALAITKEASAVADLANYRQIVPSGCLRVSMPPNFIDFVQKDFFQKFIEKYPSVSLELDFSSRRVDIHADNFDLAIRMAAKLSDDATLVARSIKEMSGGLYASPDYLKKYGTPKQPKELEKHIGLYLANSVGDIQKWCLSNGSQKWEGLPGSPVTANSIDIIRLLTVQGIGIAPFASALVQEAVDKGELIRVLKDWQVPSTTMWAITLGRKLLPMKTQVFLKELKQAL